MNEKSISISERVKQLRKRRHKAGMKRVEVFVPEDKADLLKAYAAELREHSQYEARQEVRKLLSQAYRRYRASCLDNINVNPKSADFADAIIVATALMHRGNAEAFKLGRQIKRLAT